MCVALIINNLTWPLAVKFSPDLPTDIRSRIVHNLPLCCVRLDLRDDLICTSVLTYARRLVSSGVCVQCVCVCLCGV